MSQSAVEFLNQIQKSLLVSTEDKRVGVCIASATFRDTFLTKDQLFKDMCRK